MIAKMGFRVNQIVILRHIGFSNLNFNISETKLLGPFI